MNISVIFQKVYRLWWFIPVICDRHVAKKIYLWSPWANSGSRKDFSPIIHLHISAVIAATSFTDLFFLPLPAFMNICQAYFLYNVPSIIQPVVITGGSFDEQLYGLLLSPLNGMCLFEESK